MTAQDISIHAPREGGDIPLLQYDEHHVISIHAPREGGDIYLSVLEHKVDISIHAPREGGDQWSIPWARWRRCISIHAPREGGDLLVGRTHGAAKLFQSTPPARGATASISVISPGHLQYFNPRPPRGGRRQNPAHGTLTKDFNPRPPRGGATCPTRSGRTRRLIFQSTPPARGATFYRCVPLYGFRNFNPRPPRGGRPKKPHWHVLWRYISIHAPREGGDTHTVRIPAKLCVISIHAPREGGDRPQMQQLLDDV